MVVLRLKALTDVDCIRVQACIAVIVGLIPDPFNKESLALR